MIGSSTAEGAGPLSQDSTWVNRLRAEFAARHAMGAPDVRVVNIARGGYTTYHLLPTGSPLRAPDGAERPAVDEARNITKALSFHPVAIVLGLGSNDAADGYSLAEQERNFAAITATADAAHVPIWVTTTQPRGLDAAGRAAQVALRDWFTATYGDHAIDFWTGFATPDNALDAQWDSGGRGPLQRRRPRRPLPPRARLGRRRARPPRRRTDDERTPPGWSTRASRPLSASD